MTIQDKSNVRKRVLNYPFHMVGAFARMIKDRVEQQIYQKHHDQGYLEEFPGDRYSGISWGLSEGFEYNEIPHQFERKLTEPHDQIVCDKYKSLFSLNRKLEDNEYNYLTMEVENFLDDLKKELISFGFENVKLGYSIRNRVQFIKEKGLLRTKISLREIDLKCVIVSYSVDW